jgi:DnaJ-domain-containing protein 1
MAAGALSIKLRCASWQQLATIYQRDLSRGTMFLKASNPPAVGTNVRIDLTLPSSSVIVLTGVVQQHVNDPQRGQGVELKLAPIPTGSVWLIESALASEQRQQPTAANPIRAGAVATLTEGAEISEAETELIRALGAEAESLKKLNPFLVLGVAYDVNDAEVRAAFGELTKKYHPDRFARYESTQLRQVAAEIFILIRDAYRKLGDASGRAQALAAIKQPARATGSSGQQAMRRTPPQGVSAQSIPVRTSDVKSGPIRTVGAVHDAGTVRKPPEPSLLEQKPTPKPGSLNVHDAGTVRKPDPASVTDKLPTNPGDTSDVDALVDAGKLEEAIAAFRMLTKKHPQERVYRAGIELCEGLRALTNRDRLEAAQRFEAALEIDPSNERAARELADMRRHATNERKGQLSRLMGKKE